MVSPTEPGSNVSYTCPVCDTKLPGLPAAPPFDAPCPDCGYDLWCYKLTVNGIVVLRAVTGRLPEHGEVTRLADALTAGGAAPRVVVELSAFDFMSSAFIARLVALNKRIVASGGRLILCGLHPFVREAFHDSRLEQIFEICDDEPTALAALAR